MDEQEAAGEGCECHARVQPEAGGDAVEDGRDAAVHLLVCLDGLAVALPAGPSRGSTLANSRCTKTDPPREEKN